VKQPNPKSIHLNELSKTFGALANPNRLSIVSHLRRGEMCVTALANAVGLSQSALSQHLIKLKAVGLLEAKRDRQMQIYSLTVETGSMFDTLLSANVLPIPHKDETQAIV
jgi:DNA-binding transcriptional ArsR family regulator